MFRNSVTRQQNRNTPSFYSWTLKSQFETFSDFNFDHIFSITQARCQRNRTWARFTLWSITLLPHTWLYYSPILESWPLRLSVMNSSSYIHVNFWNEYNFFKCLQILLEPQLILSNTYCKQKTKVSFRLYSH